MKFELKVVEEGEVLSNHTGLTLDTLMDIVEGFYISSDLQDLSSWKKRLDRMSVVNNSRIKEIMDNIDWSDYQDLSERLRKGASDYIEE